MLSVSDRENLLLWGKYYIGSVTSQNNVNLNKGVPLSSCCNNLVKVYMLMDLIDCSEGVLDDDLIDNLYRRLQCLIKLNT